MVKNICSNYCRKLGQLRVILTRSFETDGHRASYQHYETTVLYYRSTAFQWLMLLYSVTLIIAGRAKFQTSEQLLESLPEE